MFDWFYNYFFESYKTKNDKVIHELNNNFKNKYNTKSKAEREPLITALRIHFILNGVKRNAEAHSKLIQCNYLQHKCPECQKLIKIDVRSYAEIIENKWYLVGGDSESDYSESDYSESDYSESDYSESDYSESLTSESLTNESDSVDYHCLFAGPYSTEKECENYLDIPHVYSIRGSQMLRLAKMMD